MDEEVAVAEQVPARDWTEAPCLICGRTMWEPEAPTWLDFYGNQCGSLSPLLGGLTLDQHLRVSLCGGCINRARAQGRVSLITRDPETGERSSRAWGSMSDEQAVAWLREQVRMRLTVAKACADYDSNLRWHDSLVRGNGNHTIRTDSSQPVCRIRLDDCEGDEPGEPLLSAGAVAIHIAANDPRQIIADCEADLAIMDAHGKPRHYCPLPVLGSEHGQLWTPEEGPCWTVHRVASKYCHQDGYAKHWSDA